MTIIPRRTLRSCAALFAALARARHRRRSRPPSGQTPSIVTSGEAIDSAARRIGVRHALRSKRARAVPRDAQRQNADAHGGGAAADRRRRHRPRRGPHTRLLDSNRNSTSPTAAARRAATSPATASRSGSTRSSAPAKLSTSSSRPARPRSSGVRFDLKDRACGRARGAASRRGRCARPRRCDRGRRRPHRRSRPPHRRHAAGPRRAAAADDDARAAAAAPDMPTPIEPGLIEIRAQVTLTVAIK